MLIAGTVTFYVRFNKKLLTKSKLKCNIVNIRNMFHT